MLPPLGKLSLVRHAVPTGAPEGFDELSFMQAVLAVIKTRDVASACEMAGKWCVELNRSGRAMCASDGLRDEWRMMVQKVFTEYAPFVEIDDPMLRFFQLCKLPADRRFDDTLGIFETAWRAARAAPFHARRREVAGRQMYFLDTRKQQEWRDNEIAAIDAEERAAVIEAIDELRRAKLAFVAENSSMLRLLFYPPATHKTQTTDAAGHTSYVTTQITGADLVIQLNHANGRLNKLVIDASKTYSSDEQKMTLMRHMKTIYDKDVEYDFYSNDLLDWVVEQLYLEGDNRAIVGVATETMYILFMVAAYAADRMHTRAVRHQDYQKHFARRLGPFFQSSAPSPTERIGRARLIANWTLHEDTTPFNPFELLFVSGRHQPLVPFMDRLVESLLNSHNEKMQALRALAAIANTNLVGTDRADVRTTVIRITSTLHSGGGDLWIRERDLLRLISLLQEGTPAFDDLLEPPPVGLPVDQGAASSSDAQHRDRDRERVRSDIAEEVAHLRTALVDSNPTNVITPPSGLATKSIPLVKRLMHQMITHLAQPDAQAYRDAWNTTFLTGEDAQLTDLLRLAGETLTNTTRGYPYRASVATFLVGLYIHAPGVGESMLRADVYHALKKFLDDEPSFAASAEQDRTMSDSNVAVWRGVDALHAELSVVHGRAFSADWAAMLKKQRRLVCIFLMGVAAIKRSEIDAQLFRPAFWPKKHGVNGIKTMIVIYLVRLVELGVLDAISVLFKSGDDPELNEIIEALFEGMSQQLRYQYSSPFWLDGTAKAYGLTRDRVEQAFIKLSRMVTALGLRTFERTFAEHHAVLERGRVLAAAELGERPAV